MLHIYDTATNLSPVSCHLSWPNKSTTATSQLVGELFGKLPLSSTYSLVQRQYVVSNHSADLHTPYQVQQYHVCCRAGVVCINGLVW